MQQHTQSEQWRAIPGFEGRYEISTLGRVYSLPYKGIRNNGWRYTVKGQMLEPSKRGDFYKRVGIGGKVHRVHRLVMETFVGPCPDGMEVRHLNGDRYDNRLCNLQYGTSSENSWDVVSHGRNRNKEKTHCKRGHLLVEPNLAAAKKRLGYRECRACALARGGMNYGPGMTLQELADAKYRIIMGGAAAVIGEAA